MKSPHGFTQIRRIGFGIEFLRSVQSVADLFLLLQRLHVLAAVAVLRAVAFVVGQFFRGDEFAGVEPAVLRVDEDIAFP